MGFSSILFPSNSRPNVAVCLAEENIRDLRIDQVLNRLTGLHEYPTVQEAFRTPLTDPDNA